MFHFSCISSVNVTNSSTGFSGKISEEKSDGKSAGNIHLDFDGFIIAGSPDLAPKLFKSKELKKSIKDRVIEYKLTINANNDTVRGFNEAVMKSAPIFEEFKRKQDLKVMNEFMTIHEERPNSVCIGFEETLFCIETQIVKKVLYSNHQKYAFCVQRRGLSGRIDREFVHNEPENGRGIKVEDTKTFLKRMCGENGIEFVVVDIEEDLLAQCVGVLHDGIDLSLYHHAQEEVKEIPETIWSEEDQIHLERALEQQRQLKRKKRTWDGVADMVPGKSAEECKARYKQIRKALKKRQGSD